MLGTNVLTGSVAVSIKFLTCLSALNAPEFYNLDPDLPGEFLPRLFDRRRLYDEIDDLLSEARRSWKTTANKEGVVVKSHFVPRYKRKLFLAEADISATPKKLVEVLWTEAERMVEWNPDAMDVRTLKHFDEATRIAWQVTRSQVAGWIGPRDFVNLSLLRLIPLSSEAGGGGGGGGGGRQQGPPFRSDYDEARFAVDMIYTNTTWPSVPADAGDFVRAANGPSTMRFVPIPGEKPGEIRSKMFWLFNSDMKLSSVVIRFMNAMLSSSLIDYVQHLRQHVAASSQ